MKKMFITSEPKAPEYLMTIMVVYFLSFLKKVFFDPSSAVPHKAVQMRGVTPCFYEDILFIITINHAYLFGTSTILFILFHS